VRHLLIRDIPEHVLAAVDAKAARLGISRNEYVRRRLAQDAAATAVTVTVEDLQGFARAFTDLADPSVMGTAWQ
jgi:hypothetical protein